MVKRSILISVAAAYENTCPLAPRSPSLDPHVWQRPQRSSQYLGLRRALCVEMFLRVAVWRTGCEYPPGEGAAGQLRRRLLSFCRNLRNGAYILHPRFSLKMN